MSDINEQAKGVSSEHLGEAARMWCEKETEKIVMIPELAVVIAKSLQSRDAKIQKLESDLKIAVEALESIATYKVTEATCTDVDQEAGVINFTVGQEVELYDERAELAREALGKLK